MDNENTSRLEQYLQAIADGTGGEGLPVPQSRLEEIFLAIATGDASHCPKPQSRLEAYACACVGAGGGTAAADEVAGLIEGTIEHLESDTATRIGEYSFFQRDHIKSIKMPNITEIASHGCCYCHNLEVADIGASALRSNAFYGCTNLKTLVLRSSEVCAMETTSLFGATPFNTDGQSGTAYVPAALIESYKIATNWSSLFYYGNCKFETIEGSEYE